MKTGLFLLGISVGAALAAAQEAAQAAPQPAAKQPAQMQTMTYRGVLVDTACAAPEGAAKPAEGTANRAAGECAVTEKTANLGIKLADGRVVRFDLVGTRRAEEEMKTNKRWSRDLAAGKPIHATVEGVMANGKLVVSSIH
ncbi:MAG TPA: hypothetical protein VKX45_05755 [Bryobacteraceae bacterium]|jgi:hypothetical protein|nr:hypothetical protein [Bryobacteraceae bacterium]